MELQKNYITKIAYEGQNQAYLMNYKEEAGFESNEWLTFLQAKEKGLKIKKGSKGISLVRFINYAELNEKTDKVEDKVGRKYFRVFNLDQTGPFKKEGK